MMPKFDGIACSLHYDSKGVLVRAVTRNDTSLIVENAPIVVRRASPRAAYLSTNVLQTVMSEGTGAGASKYGATGPLGGKTGTTNDYKNSAFIGYAPIWRRSRPW